jgi:hypothetical protein
MFAIVAAEPGQEVLEAHPDEAARIALALIQV